MAMLVVLETLSPDERAVFVLREVFGFDYDEIASAMGKSAAAVRQMAHRAREHVQSRRKRFDPVDPKLSAEITAQFLAAAATGDVDGLMEMLRRTSCGPPTATARSARPAPILGAEKVARVIVGLVRGPAETGSHRAGDVQQRPGAVVYLGDSLEGVITVEIIDGRITHFYAMRNPDKLAGSTIRRDDQPLASVKLGRCGSTGSATWAAPPRCCGPVGDAAPARPAAAGRADRRVVRRAGRDRAERGGDRSTRDVFDVPRARRRRGRRRWFGYLSFPDAGADGRPADSRGGRRLDGPRAAQDRRRAVVARKPFRQASFRSGWPKPCRAPRRAACDVAWDDADRDAHRARGAGLPGGDRGG